MSTPKMRPRVNGVTIKPVGGVKAEYNDLDLRPVPRVTYPTRLPCGGSTKKYECSQCFTNFKNIRSYAQHTRWRVMEGTCSRENGAAVLTSRIPGPGPLQHKAPAPTVAVTNAMKIHKYICSFCNGSYPTERALNAHTKYTCTVRSKRTLDPGSRVNDPNSKQSSTTSMAESSDNVCQLGLPRQSECVTTQNQNDQQLITESESEDDFEGEPDVGYENSDSDFYPNSDLHPNSDPLSLHDSNLRIPNLYNNPKESNTKGFDVTDVTETEFLDMTRVKVEPEFQYSDSDPGPELQKIDGTFCVNFPSLGIKIEDDKNPGHCDLPVSFTFKTSSLAGVMPGIKVKLESDAQAGGCSVHGDEPLTETKEIGSEASKARFECPICKATYINKYNLRKHQLNRGHFRRFRHQATDLSWDQIEDDNQTTEVVQTNWRLGPFSPGYKCVICRKVLSTRKALQTHNSLTHKY